MFVFIVFFIVFFYCVFMRLFLFFTLFFILLFYFCFFVLFCFVFPLVFFYAWQSPPPAPSGAAGGGGAVRGADSQAAVDGRCGPAPARHHRAAGGRPASLTPGPASPHGICRLGSVPADVSCQKTNPHPEGSSHLEL